MSNVPIVGNFNKQAQVYLMAYCESNEVVTSLKETEEKNEK